MRAPRFHFRTTRGATLLDELTAVVVLSVGLLGLAGFQGRVQNLAANTANQTIALALAQGRLERLRGIAADPANAGSGYARIADSRETVSAIGDQHLNTPFALHVEVVRFRLQQDGAPDITRYTPAADNVPFQTNVPEFKRVSVTAEWTGKNGVAHSVTLPGIVAPGAF
jgi:type IV pilus assembly protein PilV